MNASISPAAAAAPAPAPINVILLASPYLSSTTYLPPSCHRPSRCSTSVSLHHHRPFSARVRNESSTDVSPDPPTSGRTEADKIVDGLDFGELCNEFECISSPSVEATARQLARDILELRQGTRSLGIFALSVKYKDPVRSFTGREKYKRPLWAIDAMDGPTVTVQEMAMLSTSVLSIKWIVKGKPKSFLASFAGDLKVKVTSQFTLNQISGQVIEHKEFWDLSESSTIAQAYFWASRRLFSTVESGKDFVDSVKNVGTRVTSQVENLEVYPDPTDPTKFFQNDDSFQKDVLQIALVLAFLYLVVEFLKKTL